MANKLPHQVDFPFKQEGTEDPQGLVRLLQHLTPADAQLQRFKERLVADLPERLIMTLWYGNLAHFETRDPSRPALVIRAFGVTLELRYLPRRPVDPWWAIISMPDERQQQGYWTAYEVGAEVLAWFAEYAAKAEVDE